MIERRLSSSNRMIYAFALTFSVLLISTAIFVGIYLNIQNEFSDLKTILANQEHQLHQLQDRLQQIAIQDYINATGLMPWPEIYNQIKHSVVLIETDISLGSGFVYDHQGHIVTNHHVIEDATTIQVTFLDGNITDANLVGDDPYSDLAVIRVEATIALLHPVVLGNSSALTVGEPVAAIGNPFGLSDTITAGIISSLQRELRAPGGYLIVDVIQLDAAINPGNSGGPLVNRWGQVVGINTAIIAEEQERTFLGVGFAIPADTIIREIDGLIKNGTHEHPWIGIGGIDITLAIARYLGLEKPQGFLITNVVPGSPADGKLQSGTESVIIAGRQILIGGDVIVAIDDITVRKLNDLAIYTERNKRPEGNVSLTIIRAGQKINVDLTLGERPWPPPT